MNVQMRLILSAPHRRYNRSEKGQALPVLGGDISLGSAKVIEAAAGIVTWFAEAHVRLFTRPGPA